MGAIYIADINGTTWQLAVDTSGILSVIQTPGQNPTTVILKDIAQANVWLLGINQFGELTLANSNATHWLTAITLFDTANTPWILQVNNTALQTLGQGVTVNLLGSLFNFDLVGSGVNRGPYPPAKQPGGAGTPVTMPTQQLGEITGKFYPGCGHSINSYEVISTTVTGVTTGIMRCPICGYIQKIFQPFSAIYDNDQNPYLGT